MPRPMSPISNQGNRPPLARDAQQWLLDYAIKQTGRYQHFQMDGRELPPGVATHAMISKHTGQRAIALEDLARAELDAGHLETALACYYDAALAFAQAQHPIFELNDEKRYLYAGVRRCYDQVCALAPYPLEHLDIPWKGTKVSGNLHLNPHTSGPAPLIFYIPGCDAVKEAYPHPQFNFAHLRDTHVFAFEGPGMSECNMRGVRLTADNFEDAASAALDYLLGRPEIDPDRVVVYANSFGTFWGMRFAAHDSRIKAIAAPQASICEKYIQMDLDGPRWKQLLAFATQAESEAELDQILRAMTMDRYMSKIRCPVLMTVGEYDPRAPLDEMFQLFDQLAVPAELWIMKDQFHPLVIGGRGGAEWATAKDGVMTDWLRDRLEAKPLSHPGQVLWVDGVYGPNHPSAQVKHSWYEGPTPSLSS
jgi:pimeloyl-ACP methyl ester carboxylesterase